MERSRFQSPTVAVAGDAMSVGDSMKVKRVKEAGESRRVDAERGKGR